MSVPKDFFDDKGRFMPDHLVKHILSKHPEHYLITSQTEEGRTIIWQYNENLSIYQPYGIPFFQKAADEALGDRVRMRYIKEALKLVKKRTYMPREEFVEKLKAGGRIR